MNISIASSLTVPAASITAKGAKGKAQTVAFFEIAPAAFGIESGKAHFHAVLNRALPDDKARADKALVKLARQETIVGVAAMRMPAGEFPKNCTVGPRATADQQADALQRRLNFCRLLVTSYAAPDVVNLTAKQAGRRTDVQHRILRNAEQRASVYLAELGAGNAQTDKATNSKRQTGGSQSQSDKGKGAGKGTDKPDNVPTGKAATREDALLFITQQARMLQDYANKNAKVLPTDAGTAVAQFLKSINAANNAEQERKARAAAKAAEKEKQPA